MAAYIFFFGTRLTFITPSSNACWGQGWAKQLRKQTFRHAQNFIRGNLGSHMEPADF